MVEDLELDFNLEAINTRRVGRALGKMRFRKSRDSKSKGWLVRLADLQRLAIFSYGTKFPEKLKAMCARTNSEPYNTNGTNDRNGKTARNDLEEGDA